jgi:CHASE2 domain-containing sensor protein
MLWAFSGLFDLKLFSAFDPVSQALGQFELTDQAFSNLRERPNPDERVVLVNIGTLSRGEIAQELQIISRYKPKVIGIDGFFNCEGGLRDSINCPALLDTLSNLLLSDAIQQAGNVVLVSKLLPKTETAKNPDSDHYYDSLELSDPIFSNSAKHGFANLPTDANYQEDVKECRSINPQKDLNGKAEYAFSVKLAMEYDSLKTMKFLSRGKEEEIINFRGNAETVDVRLKTLQGADLEQSQFRLLCYDIDINDVMTENFDSTLFKDKIVIMGFLGEHFGDPAWEDKYFTPLNKSVAGRANPDMFGPVIHANTVIMILNEDYIDEFEDWHKYLIAFVLCILTVALFKVIDDKLPIWYDGLSVITQIVIIILISLIIVYSFVWFTFKADLTIAMAVTALVGPCYDFLKPVQNIIEARIEKRKERALNAN